LPDVTTPQAFSFLIKKLNTEEVLIMFEADTTTTQVVVMYLIVFVFFFGLAVALVKKNS